ncbi:DUF1737 domain-containing protein [Mesorhizobium sp. NBSH29]|uniref:DUF1737 domain-containing protein n=1 Tax=Mesorhizobium sp. NBSH29 TaxID=2654249 RepID=UPI00189664BB|nr:DUF1737 domain-containing protein [Mesorhizobium sp. NBSH29]QPC85983.1 DUF1737 domain-containing protein [Mesorhizobium sp. NBSH29]
MKLYRLLTAPDDATFCHKVTAALNKGWELSGSPTYAYDAEAKIMRCGQAVVKNVDGIDYDPDNTKLSEH